MVETGELQNYLAAAVGAGIAYGTNAAAFHAGDSIQTGITGLGVQGIPVWCGKALALGIALSLIAYGLEGGSWKRWAVLGAGLGLGAEELTA